MKITTRIISAICVIAILASSLSIFTLSSSASIQTREFDCDKTVTFTIKTGSSKKPSIKFVSTVSKEYGHTCSRAPKMAITVSPAVNGESFFLISGRERKTITSTLRLEANKTYNIKVSYYVHPCNECTAKTSGGSTPMVLHEPNKYRGYDRSDKYVNGTWYIPSAKDCMISNVRTSTK